MDRGEELFQAVKQRNEWSVIKELIEAGADVNHVSLDPFEFDDTPLHNSQDPEVTALLIENGAELNSLNFKGYTPLHYAVVNGWYDTTAALIYFGADPCLASNRGLTPLMRCFRVPLFPSCPAAVRSAMIELLWNLQDDINQVCYLGSSVVTLALIVESPYLDDMIEQGGNFNSLFHDNTLLFNCILERDKEEFEWLWDGFHYIESWNVRLSVLELTLKHCRYECFEYVLHSPKIQDVIETLKSHWDYPINAILSATKYNRIRYNEEKAKEAIFVLLTRGYVPSQGEIRCAFKAYGYCELTDLFLHLVEPVTHSQWYPLVTNILLNPDKCIEIMIMNEILAYKYTVNKKGLMEAIPYVFNPKMLQCVEIYYKSDEHMLEKLRQRRVPSLMEISRNKARLAIWKGYNIKNVKDFYRTLRFMNLPKFIKDIIMFKRPLYYY